MLGFQIFILFNGQPLQGSRAAVVEDNTPQFILNTVLPFFTRLPEIQEHTTKKVLFSQNPEQFPCTHPSLFSHAKAGPEQRILLPGKIVESKNNRSTCFITLLANMTFWENYTMLLPFQDLIVERMFAVAQENS